NAPDGRASAHSPDGEGGLEQQATYDARDSFCQSIVRSAARRIAAPDSVEAARRLAAPGTVVAPGEAVARHRRDAAQSAPHVARIKGEPERVHPTASPRSDRASEPYGAT